MAEDLPRIDLLRGAVSSPCVGGELEYRRHRPPRLGQRNGVRVARRRPLIFLIRNHPPMIAPLPNPTARRRDAIQHGTTAWRQTETNLVGCRLRKQERPTVCRSFP